jgi:hypothetical protein
MAMFRVETKVDPSSKKIYAELYYPPNETVPIAQTGPVYNSHELAEADVVEMFTSALGG